MFYSLYSKAASCKVTKIRDIKRAYCIIDDKQLTCNSKIGFHQYPLNVGFTHSTSPKIWNGTTLDRLLYFCFDVKSHGSSTGLRSRRLYSGDKNYKFVWILCILVVTFFTEVSRCCLICLRILSYVLILYSEGELRPEFYGVEILVNLEGNCVVLRAIKTYGWMDL